MARYVKLFSTFLLIFVTTTLLSVALDHIPVETPNDPAVNPDANACYTGGKLEGKCDWPTEEETEWAWTCGWYAIRVEAGMFSEAALPAMCEVMFGSPEPVITECAVDDVFELNPGEEYGEVPAPGVLANDPCDTIVVEHTGPVSEGGEVVEFSLEPDGGFSYIVSDPGTVFTFDYTVEDGSTATVTVYHDMDFEPQ